MKIFKVGKQGKIMGQNYCKEFHDWLEENNAHQPEFIQAVKELTHDIYYLIDDNRDFQRQNLLYRLAEPDRVLSFRVSWEDDDGIVHVNRGWRIQHCGSLGPYKGGLRFHPSVNESILKFLAFEQTFKNALTGLPIGGGKGGANFNPKNCSEREIMRFCQAFMSELYRHIGENTDVPAGDINVGQREIGYLFGQYRRLANQFSGTLTGKDTEFGGSEVRLEATGFGLIYFVENMLQETKESIENKRIAISGAGNVAAHAALKACERGAKVISLSSSKGCYINEDGIPMNNVRETLLKPGDSSEKLQKIAEQAGGEWHEGKNPWHWECDIALPCATQNELDENCAKMLIDNGVKWVAEGANMPTTEAAIACFANAEVAHAPGKASNAGGVALSGLEMAQNSGFAQWGYKTLDKRLKDIMQTIHGQCVEHGQQADQEFINYRLGANIAAFKRISRSIMAQGVL